LPPDSQKIACAAVNLFYSQINSLKGHGKKFIPTDTYSDTETKLYNDTLNAYRTQQ
jgi:hypothetical protein